MTGNTTDGESACAPRFRWSGRDDSPNSDGEGWYRDERVLLIVIASRRAGRTHLSVTGETMARTTTTTIITLAVITAWRERPARLGQYPTRPRLGPDSFTRRPETDEFRALSESVCRRPRSPGARSFHTGRPNPTGLTRAVRPNVSRRHTRTFFYSFVCTARPPTTDTAATVGRVRVTDRRTVSHIV